MQLVSVLLAAILLSPLPSFAKKMDVETHTLVINKLERVLKESNKKPKQNLSLILRVADLYAERARLITMQEVEKNCDACMGSKTDREKAIAHYKSITPYVEGDIGATVLMQTAHLYQMVGKNKQAKKLYRGIIKDRRNRSSRVVGQAYSGLAHLEFNEGKYSSALKNYNHAISRKDVPQKGFLIYRKAWCLLNTGKTTKAIHELKTVLSSPELLDVSGGMDLVANETFQQDISRDFASFLVRKNLTANDIDLLDSLSPEKVKKTNLFYLGTEAERVGQKSAALLVWAVYTQRKDVPFEEKLEIQARRAKIHYDLNQKNQALVQYKAALKLWGSAKCRDAVDCEGIYQRLRNFPVSWNKMQKKKPTKRIHQAYRAFLETFKDDYEMHYWSAQVARNLGDYRSAVTDYRRAAMTAKSQRNHRDSAKKSSALRIYNGALLAEIEMAEADGHPQVREAAYKNYLNEISKGEKSDQVRYQLAHLDYEQKNYQRAALQFQSLARKKGVNEKTRIQSADLSLDALAVLKDHSRLESWGLEYSKLFPKRQQEYQKISSKASLNLVALTTNNKASTSSTLANAQKKLIALPVGHLDKEEQTSYWKNRLLLAEKNKDLKDIKIASRAFLKQSKLSKKDIQWAKSLQVFAHEMLFEFKSAYNVAKKMDFPKLSKADRSLKLAVLADLSGKSTAARSHYQQFIKDTSSVRKANMIRAKLVSQSRAPWSQLLENLPRLRRTPDILASITLETFGRFSNYDKAEKVLKNQPAIVKYPEGQTLRRFVFLKDYWKFDQEIRKHRIYQNSQSRLQNSLQQRLNLLNQSEKWVGKAAKTRDWTLQVITLDRLTDEYRDLHKTILRLKAPKGLTQAQRKEYSDLLMKQAEPYQAKSNLYASKTSEFWNNSKAIDSLNKDYLNAAPSVRRLIRDELNALKVRAPKNASRKIQRIVDQPLKSPSRKQLQVAYDDVREKPFSGPRLDRLIQIEEQRAKDPTLVAYLVERKNSLKGVRQ